MGWLYEKIENIEGVLNEYPRVFWRIFKYFVFAVIAAFIYSWIFNVMTREVFGGLPWVVENKDLLHWGVVVTPVLVLLWGWGDTVDLYHELKSRKYGRYY